MCHIRKILWEDPQCQIPAGICPICGGLVYRPTCRCIRCGRDYL